MACSSKTNYLSIVATWGRPIFFFLFYNRMLFSFPVVCDSLQPHGLQHSRPPCPSLSSGVCSWSLHGWCHLTSSSDSFFSFCPLSFSASGTFPMSHLYASYCVNTGFSFSISPSSEYSWLISLDIDWFDFFAVQGTFRSLLQHHRLKA